MGKLAKVSSEARISGVCAGLAWFSGVDVTIIRVLFVLVFCRSWLTWDYLFYFGFVDARQRYGFIGRLYAISKVHGLKRPLAGRL